MFGKTHTDDVKENSRKLNTGKKASIDTRKKLSNMRQGEKNHKSVLTEENVLLIREFFNKKIYNKAELSRIFCVKGPAIYKIVNRLTWKHI